MLIFSAHRSLFSHLVDCLVYDLPGNLNLANLHVSNNANLKSKHLSKVCKKEKKPHQAGVRLFCKIKASVGLVLSSSCDGKGREVACEVAAIFLDCEDERPCRRTQRDHKMRLFSMTSCYVPESARPGAGSDAARLPPPHHPRFLTRWQSVVDGSYAVQARAPIFTRTKTPPYKHFTQIPLQYVPACFSIYLLIV